MGRRDASRCEVLLEDLAPFNVLLSHAAPPARSDRTCADGSSPTFPPPASDTPPIPRLEHDLPHEGLHRDRRAPIGQHQRRLPELLLPARHDRTHQLRVPDESTVRELTRRIGTETVSELTRALIVTETKAKRFRPRGGQDRLDGDRGRREASDRYGTGIQRRAGVSPTGSQAREADRRHEGAGAGSVAVDGPQAAGDHSVDSSSVRGGAGRGARPDCRDGGAVEALGEGGAPGREGRSGHGARARSEAQAEGRRRRWSGGRIAARRSKLRSSRGSLGSRRRIGWCRCSTPRPGRSARASSPRDIERVDVFDDL